MKGTAATDALARLYEASRLHVNFFQPSFKLKSKTREGARVIKSYHAPATPYQRLIDSAHIPKPIKERLRIQFESLDPIRLLGKIRHAQGRLAAIEISVGTGENQEEQPRLVPQKVK